MGLKFEVEKLDDVAEELRSLYTEQNGKFVLGVDGVVPRAKLDEFRNNNVNLREQLETLQKQYKDIDLDQYTVLMDEHKKIKDKKLIEAGKIDELVEDRVKELRKTLETERDASAAQYKTTRGRLETVLIDNEVSRFAVEAGCVETALDDIIMRARGTFRLNQDDQTVAMDNDKVIYGADGMTPLTIKEWMGGLVKKAPHLFKQAAGGGAQGSGNGNSTSSVRSKADLKTPEAKAAFISEHGQLKYLQLPAAAK